MAICKLCGAIIEGGRTDKLFCNDAHKQRYWRQKQKEDQKAAHDTELKDLRARVRDLEQTVDDQAKEIAQLRDRLNVEVRYLRHEERSIRKYGFRAFIKKQPATLLIEKLLADPFTMPRDTRAHYEYRLPLLHCTEEERQEFTDLWKLMLLLQP
jgi:hypothetical protein